ncbi:hypothetical protein [Streptomyces violaceorubidus]
MESIAEELKELGIGETWCKFSPWDIPKAVQDLRERKARVQQETTEPAEGVFVPPEGEELAAILADIYGPEEESTEETAEPIGKNGLTLIK